MAFPAAGTDGTNKLTCQHPPQIVLLAIDLDEDLIEVEGVTITTVRSFQSLRIENSKLDAPETNSLVADGDTSLSQKIFDIAKTCLAS